MVTILSCSVFSLFLKLSLIWREISSYNWTKWKNFSSKTDIFSLVNMVNDTSFFFSRNVFLMRFHKIIKQFLKSILGQNIYKMSLIIPTIQSILFKKNIRNVTQFLSKGHKSDHICNIPLEIR